MQVSFHRQYDASCHAAAYQIGRYIARFPALPTPFRAVDSTADDLGGGYQLTPGCDAGMTYSCKCAVMDDFGTLVEVRS